MVSPARGVSTWQKPKSVGWRFVTAGAGFGRQTFVVAVGEDGSAVAAAAGAVADAGGRVAEAWIIGAVAATTVPTAVGVGATTLAGRHKENSTRTRARTTAASTTRAI